MSHERIAIVSVAGRYPGSGPDLDRFWDQVVGAVDCSREVPPDRWVLPPDRCSDPRVAQPDRVYTTRGYYLDPFSPDLTGLNLDAGLVARLDPLFQLVLDVGNRAWRGAKTAAVDPGRVGVVLGNICLPTDATARLCRELLGPGRSRRRDGATAGPLTVDPLNRFAAGLPAGLLARGLGLGGGSYTLDAACASSLYAIKLAADELLAGRADAMLAGGCSRPDCLYTQMGFAQLRALSVTGRCSPFDAAADGLLVGEGAGIFVLKRLSDAIRHQDTILAVLAGLGLSNDMHGNLLAPAREGQLRAMRRAYRQAGWTPTDVDLIECHATGTPLGDAVEFQSLRELWAGAVGESGDGPRRCVIGSVKSTVGHLLTGAGAAALTKVLLALRHRVLPPQANFTEPAPGLGYADGPFRILRAAEAWERRPGSEPRRAAVSGFGFGGVNAHLLLEEWTGDTQVTPARVWSPPRPVRIPATDDIAAVAAVAPVKPDALGKPDGPVTPDASVMPDTSGKPDGSDGPDPLPSPPAPVAIVGMAVHFGPWDDLRSFQEAVLGGRPAPAVPKVNGWGLAPEPSPPASGIEQIRLPIDRFRIPPVELEDALPQQLLMLQVAAAAWDDCRSAALVGTGTDAPDTGVFIGLGLDLNTTNFSLRWSVLAEGADAAVADAVSPPLTANRTIGALGSIAASRIARAFHLGGPSHTVCSEEGSVARAVLLGVRALQNRELDRVIVGGVDLACDPRLVLPGRVGRPGEGAGAFVLKRLEDAERDGDRVYAVIRAVGVAGSAAEARGRAEVELGGLAIEAVPFDAAEDVGACGAASVAASLAKACLALWQQILPGPPPRYWLHDRAAGPRRAWVEAGGTDGCHYALLLEESPLVVPPACEAERLQPLGARDEAVFLVEADTSAGLLAGLDRLAGLAGQRPGRGIEALAREWFGLRSPPARLAVGLVARSPAELSEQIRFAGEHLRATPDAPLPPTARSALRDRVFYSPRPLGPGSKVAFVYPGSGNHFDGMGRDLSGQWPEVLRRQQAENAYLRGQFAPDHFWDGRADAAPARELMFGQVTVGSLVSDILSSLGIRCDAMIGVSLGESAGLFGVRVWTDRDEMFRRMRRSSLFTRDLAPPYEAARRYWNLPPGEVVDWTVAVVAAPAADVTAHLRPDLRAYLLIVTTSSECVVGGVRPDVERLVAAVGRPVTYLSGVTLAHCPVARTVEDPYRELHTLPVPQPSGVTVYSAAWGHVYEPTPANCAESITAGLLQPIDVPRLIETAYRDGVRVFIEVGPGTSCVRAIEAVLGDRPHLARAAHAARQDAVSQILRLVAHLAAERVAVDLSSLYGTETRCVGHRRPADGAAGNRVVTVPVGLPPRHRDDAAVSGGAVAVSGGAVAVAVSAGAAVAVSAGAASAGAAVAATGAVGAPVVALLSPRAAGVSPAPAVTTYPSPVPLPSATAGSPPVDPASGVTAQITAVASLRAVMTEAHDAFLRTQRHATDLLARLLGLQQRLLGSWLRQAPRPNGTLGDRPGHDGDGAAASGGSGAAVGSDGSGRAAAAGTPAVPRSLTYEQCCTYAAGRIQDVLGPLYAEIDTFPTRVRLPDGPLQLVDRITRIEGEPLSLSRGRVVTEHTVRPDRWYLESGRIPTALSVEAGQADLFLSGFLGIDLRTRGLAVYRLLDAVVTFHRGLPRVGETIVYDIAIDEFVYQGGAWLFRFRFDGTVNGEPFITMRDGVAGFFTAEALAAGKGIVQTALDRQPRPGKRPPDWQDLVGQEVTSLTAEQVAALRAGDLAAAFGPTFAGLPLRRPLTLPDGMLRLIDRVPLIDPAGGRFGLGLVRAELDIHPQDWFLTCHFVDDQVMPGTLMYECCLHTLRVLLLRLGWVGESGEVACEPVPGVSSRLKCRGQVTAATRTVMYEVTVKELGYDPDPYCLADALMSADGKPIVEITNLSLRLSGLTRERLERMWGTGRGRRRGRAEDHGVGGPGVLRPEPVGSEGVRPEPVGSEGVRPEPVRRVLYDSASILAFSNGNPSEAFGEPYRIFDRDRVIARLPGPPFQFLDRIVSVTGEPFVMKAGAACVAEYDVPPDAWYFAENRCRRMPFSVLLEIGLQPCGWLAAYCGSALTSPVDLSFRNLGGRATQLRPVGPESGRLTTAVRMTSVSSSAGMIIQHFTMEVRDAVGPVYAGTTYFGFFSRAALANQVGIRDARVPYPSRAERLRGESGLLPTEAPFPGPMLRMIDRIDVFVPDGGRKGLGLAVGKIAVDPGFWFFQAHFYQDPVWPGSLGLESFLQLLKFVAWRRWGRPSGDWQTVALNRPHTWLYRGQVLPSDGEVTVVLEVTDRDDQRCRLTADGFLLVDGRVIYQMTDFSLE